MRFEDCSITTILFLSKIYLAFSRLTEVLRPIDSSSSIVPPVNPNPLPDILKSGISKQARNGGRIKVTLSPTPPVVCLSIVLGNVFNVKPEFLIAIVN